MLCQKCKKNNANIFYKETVNGETKSFSYCSECADEAQKNGEINFNMDNPFSSGFFKPFANLDNLLGSMLSVAYPFSQNQGKGSISAEGTVSPPSKANEKHCDMCGITLNELAREGKAGCPKCYETFSSELSDSLRRIHGNVAHTGRAPKLLKDRLNKNKRLRTLKNELQSAIESQEFEKAASIRDEIRSLEQ